MNSPKGPPPSRRFPIWLFIGLFAISDFLVVPVTAYAMGRAGPSTLFVRLWSGLVYGVIFGQLSLLSIWAVFGPSSALVRLPLTTMVGMSLAACLVAGYAAAVGIGGVPGETALVFLFVPLVLLSAQVPLWVLKLVTGGRIVRRDARTGQMPTVQRQFGIVHLMAATVVVALALGLASSGLRLLGAQEAFEGMDILMRGVLTSYCGLSCVLSLLVALPCLWAGLGAKNPRAGAVGLAIYAGLITLLWGAVLVLSSPGPVPGEAVAELLLYGGSLMLVTLGTLYVARRCGYRYQRGGRPKPAVATAAPSAAGPETSAEMQEAEMGTEESLDESPADRGDEP